MALHLIVNGDAIGPADADVDQDRPLRAVKTRLLDTRVLAPLGPEQVAAHKNAHSDIFLKGL